MQFAVKERQVLCKKGLIRMNRVSGQEGRCCEERPFYQ